MRRSFDDTVENARYIYSLLQNMTEEDKIFVDGFEVAKQPAQRTIVLQLTTEAYIAVALLKSMLMPNGRQTEQKMSFNDFMEFRDGVASFLFGLYTKGV